MAAGPLPTPIQVADEAAAPVLTSIGVTWLEPVSTT